MENQENIKNPAKVRSGKRSKAKGANFELKIAKLLESWWSKASPKCRFRRTPGSGGWSRAAENMEGFGAAGDVVTSDKSFPFTIECKHHADWTLDSLITSNVVPPIMTWWNQAVEQTPEGLSPLLFFKRNNAPTLAMFSYQRFPSHKVSVADLIHNCNTLKFNGILGETLVIMSLADFLTINPQILALDVE